MTKMHVDELDIDVGLVRRLVAGQFPDWAELPLERVEPVGTDNAIFRLGDDLAVRLPRRERTNVVLQKERRWLSKLAPLLSLSIPVPVGDGAPSDEFPLEWFVYRWLPGVPATDSPPLDYHEAAMDLAAFIASLQGVDTAGGPPPGDHNFFRGEPLECRDGATRKAIEQLGRRLDARTVSATWDTALDAAAWTGAPVWIHGDLDARNLIVQRGRLSAVIDWGCLGVGDPACDVMVAWKLLPADARELFRVQLGIDEATWARAGGWALSQAVDALAYYTPETNAVLVREAERWLDAVLENVA